MVGVHGVCDPQPGQFLRRSGAAGSHMLKTSAATVFTTKASWLRTAAS